MSLNNINLNNHLLTQLYPKTLLETEATPTRRQPEASPIPVAPAVEMKTSYTEKLQAIPASPVQAPSQTVASEPAPAPFAPPPAPVVEYGNTPSLGGNKKGILILVSNDAAPYLPDAELEFLSAILGACRLSIADVAIVNLHHYPQPYSELLKQFNSRQVLLMGVTPQQIDLPFHFPHFQLQNFDQRTYLSALPLRQMSQDRDLKMQLWGCLKRMFGV